MCGVVVAAERLFKCLAAARRSIVYREPSARDWNGNGHLVRAHLTLHAVYWSIEVVPLALCRCFAHFTVVSVPMRAALVDYAPVFGHLPLRRRTARARSTASVSSGAPLLPLDDVVRTVVEFGRQLTAAGLSQRTRHASVQLLVKAKFHYAIWFEPASNQLRTS